MDKTHTKNAIRIAIGITMLVLLLAGGAGAMPYEEWNRTYGGFIAETAYSVQQTSDGGYITAGVSCSTSATCDFFIVKTNSSGHEQWNHTFGGAGDDRAYSVLQTSDGGYLITGYMAYDAWLMKLNSSGNQVWSRAIYSGTARSVKETSDGGYIVAGYTNSIGGYDKAWLVKTNSSGYGLWNKTYGGTSPDYAYSVQQTSDGGYIFAGDTSSFGFGRDDAWLVKTDSSGNEQWNKTFGGAGLDYARSVQQTSDGGYILAGDTSSFGSGSTDAWLIKTNSSGHEQWNHTFGGVGDDSAYSVLETLDGGYALAGDTGSFESGRNDAWLVKTNSSGHEQWNHTFGGTNYDYAYSVQQTSDGGYILAGVTLSFGYNNDAWLVKVSSDYPVHNINKSTHYSTIQSALDDADSGNEIHVDRGTYYENVKVNKSVTLVGAGADVTIVNASNPNDHVFNVTVNSVNITGFKVTGATSDQNAGFYLYNTRYNNIIGNNASNNWAGFYLYSSSNNNITGNNASNNMNGIYLGYSSNNNNLTDNNASNNFQGIYLYSSSNNNIKGNNVLNNSYGIIISDSSSNNNITGNNFLSNNTYGIYLVYSNNNNLKDNKASNNTYGILLLSSSNNNITGNNASNNFQVGICLHSSSNNNTLIGNNANLNNYYGINLESFSNNNTLSGNNVSNNSAGILLNYYSNNNTIRDNNASNNSIGIYLGASSNNTLGSNNANSNFVGISLSASNNNTLSDNNFSNNYRGIYLNAYCNNNTLSGNNANSNIEGIVLVYSSNNTLSSNYVNSNANYGIYLESFNNNFIYNNIFNNTNNTQFYFYGSNINTWNTTRQSSPNIIGGPYLGGNFWAYPNGTGFSQTCTNTNSDDICDSPYILDANNTDYLPLTSINTILPLIRFINGTVKDNSTGNSLSGVTVSANSPLSTTSDATGFYSFAVTNGTYNLVSTINDIRYYTNTTTVSTNGQAAVIQDIEMVRKPTGNITGSVQSVAH